MLRFRNLDGSEAKQSRTWRNATIQIQQKLKSYRTARQLPSLSVRYSDKREREMAAAVERFFIGSNLLYYS